MNKKKKLVRAISEIWEPWGVEIAVGPDTTVYVNQN